MIYRIKRLLKVLAHKFVSKLTSFSRPDDRMLVPYLAARVSFLDLSKDECAFLASVNGTYGDIKLTGGMLSVFEYRVFEKSIMEFIKVRVEVAPPSRIQFITTIESTTAPERNGEVIKSKEAYEKPFWTIAYSFWNYFPLSIYGKVKVIPAPENPQGVVTLVDTKNQTVTISTNAEEVAKAPPPVDSGEIWAGDAVPVDLLRGADMRDSYMMGFLAGRSRDTSSDSSFEGGGGTSGGAGASQDFSTPDTSSCSYCGDDS